MLKKGERSTYYISNVGTCSLSMIDGNSFGKIKEIRLDARPQKIVVDDRNNVFIACDRNNRITCIHNSKSVNQTWDIPNNGNLQVDSHTQMIYAGNADEIGIYSLENGELIASIKGFTAADCLRLDYNRKRLFVLDLLENVIKVFSTESYKLIREYKNVGMAPNDFILGSDEQFLYVANKGIKNKECPGNISIVDINTGNISYINMKNDAVITALEQNNVYLYAANYELHQIEVIDLAKRQYITSIKTTFPFIKRLRLSPDNEKLFVISLDNDRNGVIDKIDTDRNVVINTFFREEKSIPYDIGVVIQGVSKVKKTSCVGFLMEKKRVKGEKEDKGEKEEKKNKEEKEDRIDNEERESKKDNDEKEEHEERLRKEDNSKRNVNDREELWKKWILTKERKWSKVNRWNKEDGMNLLAKEVISIYQEKVVFPEVLINFRSSEMALLKNSEVVFQKCIMNSESIKRCTILGRKEYSVLQYDFCLPYYFRYIGRQDKIDTYKESQAMIDTYKESQDKIKTYQGKMEETQKVTLFLPTNVEQLGVEFVVNSFAKLIGPPIFEDNIMRFEVSALISTMVVIDKTVHIPLF